MKLNVQDQEINIIGDMESTEFTIKFDAKMAELLSSSLYKNKIKSIIRELSCNAYDSHVEAKQKRPFDVILPTYLDSKFIIRDYGTGLTPEKIKEVYTCYGASDKLNSNKVVGCMGLGSKTPACYHTKSALIDSYVDGKHWSYQFHIGEKGIPCLTKLSELSTDEPNGVKITIPVKTSDIYYFGMEAKRVYQWFDQKPNCKIAYDQVSKILDYDIADECSVLMGNVLYPIDNFGIPEHLKPIYETRLVLRVKIGEVDPSISREGLQYTEKTKKNIIKYLQEAYDKIIRKDLFDDCKTFHDARLKLIKSNIPLGFHSLYRFNNQHVSLTWPYSDNLVYYDAATKEFLPVRGTTVKDIPIYISDSSASRIRIINNDKNCYYVVGNFDTEKDRLKLTLSDVIGTSTLPYTPVKPQKKLQIVSGREVFLQLYSCKLSKSTPTPKEKYYYCKTNHLSYEITKKFKLLKAIDSQARLFLGNKLIEKDTYATNLEDFIENFIKNNRKLFLEQHICNNDFLFLLINNYQNLPQKLKNLISPYKDMKCSSHRTLIEQSPSDVINEVDNLKSKIYNLYPILEYIPSNIPFNILLSVLKD